MEVLQFALLGLGAGALYSLASQGLIVIYRGSGVLNFAQGAIGMIGAYVMYELRVVRGLPFPVALIAGVAAAALIGALVHVLIMRRLQRAAPLARIVATLGVMVLLTSLAVRLYGVNARFLPSELPTDILQFFGVTISADRLWLFGLAAVISVALWAAYRFTPFGHATTAVAENQRAAAALGISGNRIAVANWAIGSGLAGLAAILITPIVTLQPMALTDLVLAALAAALVAGFRSFPIAFVAGTLMGVVQAVLQRFSDVPGLAQSLPFLVVIVLLVVGGRALPLRDFYLQRLPAVGSGRIRWFWLLAAVLAAVVVIAIVPPKWVDAFTLSFAMATILLSILVITGYAGQLSLAQFAIAGIGALFAGWVTFYWHWPFLAAMVVAILGTVAVGALFAVPALRTRGINLAIATLGLGTTIELMVFNNRDLVGGSGGMKIGEPTLFGLDINAVSEGRRYSYVALAVLVLLVLAVANVRRGRSGRRMLAVRSNERAAASLGISVVGAKLYAFSLGAGIAAAGGIMLAFRNQSIQFPTFDSFTSVTSVGYAFLGGIGYLAGPVVGAGLLAPGALGGTAMNQWLTAIAPWLQVIAGLSIIIVVVTNQDGIVKETVAQFRWLFSRIPGLRRLGRKRPAQAMTLPPETWEKVRPQTLELRGASVRYGGVVALDDVSFTVRPGSISALIGPNGAGKTTAIDAITGFAPLHSGQVLLDGHDLADASATKRARLGISRSFQSLELFEDATVLDNLRAASDPRDRISYLRDLVWPRQAILPGPVVAAIKEFGLEHLLQTHVQDLSYGQRRLLAIARAVASQPSVLLLDEPAAGLGDAETAELAHLVRRLTSRLGIAVLLIEHDMNFVMSISDHIVVLDFGRKISDGTPTEVRDDQRVIAAYLGGGEDQSAPPEAVQAPPALAVPLSGGAQ